MDRELLIEIGCEEIPAGWLPDLTRQVGEQLDVRLKELRLETDAPAETYSTPRRLTARVVKLAERQKDFEELVQQEQWRVPHRIFLAGQRKVDILPNLRAEVAVYVVRR